MKVLVAIAALYFGLSLPVIKVRGLFGATDYSVWGGVKGLWEDSEHLLAIIVFLFSFVTPIAKLALIARLWFTPMAAASSIVNHFRYDTTSRSSVLSQNW